jgi:hypothetical protein
LYGKSDIINNGAGALMDEFPIEKMKSGVPAPGHQRDRRLVDKQTKDPRKGVFASYRIEIRTLQL